MTTKLEQVLQDIEALTHEERRKVQEALEGLLQAPESDEEQEFLRIAEERGIRITLPTKKMTDEEFDRFKPITVRGEPISETIIRERR